MDVYLFWRLGIAATGGFDFTPYPAIRDPTQRIHTRPSFLRALTREQAALERAGIELPGDGRL